MTVQDRSTARARQAGQASQTAQGVTAAGYLCNALLQHQYGELSAASSSPGISEIYAIIQSLSTFCTAINSFCRTSSFHSLQNRRPQSLGYLLLRPPGATMKPRSLVSPGSPFRSLPSRLRLVPVYPRICCQTFANSNHGPSLR